MTFVNRNSRDGRKIITGENQLPRPDKFHEFSLQTFPVTLLLSLRVFPIIQTIFESLTRFPENVSTLMIIAIDGVTRRCTES